MRRTRLMRCVASVSREGRKAVLDRTSCPGARRRLGGWPASVVASWGALVGRAPRKWWAPTAREDPKAAADCTSPAARTVRGAGRRDRRAGSHPRARRRGEFTQGPFDRGPAARHLAQDRARSRARRRDRRRDRQERARDRRRSCRSATGSTPSERVDPLERARRAGLLLPRHRGDPDPREGAGGPPRQGDRGRDARVPRGHDRASPGPRLEAVRIWRTLKRREPRHRQDVRVLRQRLARGRGPRCARRRDPRRRSRRCSTSATRPLATPARRS